MVRIGEFNTLKIVRKASFGYYLDADTGNTSDDILLPNGNVTIDDIRVGIEVEVFIYRDSKDRPIATMKKPFAEVNQIAYLKVVSKTSIGAFVDFGLERDVFVPMREQKYEIEKNNYYLFYIYLDKTNRIAATTDIDKHLENAPDGLYKIESEVNCVVYGFQTNNTIMAALDNKYRGIILKNEIFVNVKEGYELKVRVKKVYEDGKLGLTPRKKASDERKSLEDDILNYLKKHDGYMPYNDKSSPEDIRKVFKESKNYFKNALGGLMKRNLVTQDSRGTFLKN
ncbi:DNA-binding protein [Clostridium fermenticellae]|uniref:DNA-binding protein n=1 Tax=Clostridium fermenticellae TaxID=2068654 RepID=A0A386H5R0_9CLOT|nr:S1-like domain-containing RNA-binding protein [Clostridium fermenticellae]AYD41081.1 DNA-binding protein [Clostridium fermenticellae]